MSLTNENTIALETEPETTHSPASPDRRSYFWAKRILLVLTVLVAGLLIFAWYAYQTAQVVPDYYQSLLEQPVEELELAGDEFESEVLELQNVAIKTGNWQATFSQDQINGWLASDLPEKFPKTIPRNVSQPRVSMNANDLIVVFRFESKRFSGIVEASVDAYCTDNLNEIAVRIKHVKSGLISLPIAPWTDRISKVMLEHDFPIRWTEDDGDMVALVELPRKISDQKDQKRIIESIQVLDGKLSLRGVTLNPQDLDAYQASVRTNQPPSLLRR